MYFEGNQVCYFLKGCKAFSSFMENKFVLVMRL